MTKTKKSGDVALVPRKRETRAEFFARNLGAGRPVRFSIVVDMNHLTEEQRNDYDLRLGVIKVTDGTLSAWSCKKILDIIFANEARSNEAHDPKEER